MVENIFEPLDCFDAMIERLDREEQARQEVGTHTGKALKLAKKAIFALQRRGDAVDARRLLVDALAVLAELDRAYGQTKTRLTSGQWRVAVEEYLEGLFFLRFFENKALTGTDDDELLSFEVDGTKSSLHVEDQEVFGALSDLTGELYRQMQLWISHADYSRAIMANRAIAQVTELLNQNTAGGNLRNKVDQANRNLHNSDARITDLRIRGLLD
jgi:predicted translin family RNA/ssDNA-binding protein